MAVRTILRSSYIIEASWSSICSVLLISLSNCCSDRSSCMISSSCFSSFSSLLWMSYRRASLSYPSRARQNLLIFSLDSIQISRTLFLFSVFSIASFSFCSRMSCQFSSRWRLTSRKSRWLVSRNCELLVRILVALLMRVSLKSRLLVPACSLRDSSWFWITSCLSRKRSMRTSIIFLCWSSLRSIDLTFACLSISKMTSRFYSCRWFRWLRSVYCLSFQSDSECESSAKDFSSIELCSIIRTEVRKEMEGQDEKVNIGEVLLVGMIVRDSYNSILFLSLLLSELLLPLVFQFGHSPFKDQLHLSSHVLHLPLQTQGSLLDSCLPPQQNTLFAISITTHHRQHSFLKFPHLLHRRFLPSPLLLPSLAEDTTHT